MHKALRGFLQSGTVCACCWLLEVHHSCYIVYACMAAGPAGCGRAWENFLVPCINELAAVAALTQSHGVLVNTEHVLYSTGMLGSALSPNHSGHQFWVRVLLVTSLSVHSRFQAHSLSAVLIVLFMS
jgi:hypothetical protein